MEFKNRTNVITADGRHAGDLDRVVIHPETKVVTHIVVHDRVVAIEKVLTATQEQISISSTLDEFKEFSPLTITQMEPRVDGEPYENMNGGIYANTSLDPYVIKEIIRSIPDDLVALKEGASVMSTDGKHIGNVEMVMAEDGQATQFQIAHGLLFKTQNVIPVEWIQAMTDDEIKLTVSAQKFEELPKN